MKTVLLRSLTFLLSFAASSGTPAAAQPVINFYVELEGSVIIAPRGAPVSFRVRVGTSATYSGPIEIRCLDLPSTVTCQTQTLVLGPAVNTSAFMVVGPPAGFLGTLNFRFRVSAGPQIVDLPATLTINPPPLPTTSVFPLSRTIRQGESAAFDAIVYGRSSVPVNFTLTGLPAGAVATLSPESRGPFGNDFPVSIRITTTRTTGTGTFPLTLKGILTTGDEFSAPLGLIIQPAPGLTAVAQSAAATAVPGSIANFNILLSPSNGFSGLAAVSIVGLPGSIATATVSPSPVLISGSQTTTVNISLTLLPSSSIGTIPFEAVITASGVPELRVRLVLTVDRSAPQISTGGVADAASLSPLAAPGSIVSVFGSGFADSLRVALSTPLPLSLGGIRVLVDEVAAPLFAVTPTQVNFQVPFATTDGRRAQIVVLRDQIRSPPGEIAIVPYAPAIFEYQPQPGRTDPIVTFPDGSLVSAQKPAAAGDVLVIYATGIGKLDSAVQTGALSPVPAAQSADPPEVLLGSSALEVLFAGLTPGSIGLAQFNVRVGPIPEGVTELPLSIRYGAVTSKSLKLAVKP